MTRTTTAAFRRALRPADRMLADPAFWSLGPRPSPLDIAAELARAMDAGRFTRKGTEYAQTIYTASLSAEDLSRFDGRRRELVATLKDTLAWWARERGYTLPGDLRVRLVADEALRAGQLAIEAGLRAGEAARLARSRRGTYSE